MARPLHALVIAAQGLSVRLQAHRGGRGLMPENAAFAQAIAIGVTTIELDIAITADGVPAISHYPWLVPLPPAISRRRAP